MVTQKKVLNIKRMCLINSAEVKQNLVGIECQQAQATGIHQQVEHYQRATHLGIQVFCKKIL